MGKHKGFDEDAQKIISQSWHYDSFKQKVPRYYQRRAVDLTLEAAAEGEKRVLLVMATGTGKTFTAFQIVWRLRKAGRANKVLYLADRNILIDQTVKNDFSPLKKVTMQVAKHKPDSAYEILGNS